MKKEQLIDQIEKRWQDFKTSFEGLSEQEMLEPGVSGEWCVRDIIAHVTSWEEEALNNLPIILEGEKTPRYSNLYGGIDAFNELIAERSKKLAPEETLQKCIETHNRLMVFIQGVPQEQFKSRTRFRRRLGYDTYLHYPEHTEAILVWREGSDKHPVK